MTDHRKALARRRSRRRPQWGRFSPTALFDRLEDEPAVGAAISALGDALLETADGRMLEFVALRTSAVRDCPYMWVGHCHIARRRQPEPLSDDEIARIATGADAFSGADAALVVAIDELLFNRELSADSAKAVSGRGLILQAAVLFYEAIAVIVRDAEPELEPIRGLETPAAAAAGRGRDDPQAPRQRDVSGR